MKYRIEIAGRGSEIVLGNVNRKFYDLLAKKELDISDYAWDESFCENNDIKIPKNIRPFEAGSWFECDGMAHEYGAEVPCAFFAVTDEDGNVLLDNVDISILRQQGADIEYNEIDPDGILSDGEVYFVGQTFEKGLFNSFEIEANTFVPGKLIVQITNVDGLELITGVQYDGVYLEDLGELSTDGKGTNFELVIVGED